DQAPLPQLQHRDRGERLGNRSNPEHRVLGDRGVRRDVRQPVRREGGQGPVADDPGGETDTRPSTGDLTDAHVQIDLRHGDLLHPVATRPTSPAAPYVNAAVPAAADTGAMGPASAAERPWARPGCRSTLGDGGRE